MSSFKNIIDKIDRDGYEWYWNMLIHPKAAHDYYLDKYRGKKPNRHYAWAIAWRTALMIIPVLPALYVINRVLGVLINPWAFFKNSNKYFSMALGFVAVAVGIPLYFYVFNSGFISTAINVFSGVVGSTFAPALAIGLIATAGLYVGAAVLYADKIFGQYLNFIDPNNRVDGLGEPVGVTTSKYSIDNPTNAFNQRIVPLEWVNFQKQVLYAHESLKDRVMKDPASLKQITQTAGNSPWFNDVECSTASQAAEETIAYGKKFLGFTKELMERQLNNKPIAKKDANSLAERYTQWKGYYDRISPKTFGRDEPEFVYDSQQEKMVTKITWKA